MGSTGSFAFTGNVGLENDDRVPFPPSSRHYNGPPGFLATQGKEGTDIVSTLTPNDLGRIFLLSGTKGALQFV